MMKFEAILRAVTVPCRDDGERFVDATRMDAIRSLLDGSPWKASHEAGLYTLYAQEGFDRSNAPLVLSTHADSVYGEHFARRWRGRYLLGTFDNAVTNAVAVFMMLRGLLPDRVSVAFTGNEENGMAGARQVAALVRGWSSPRVIALDVTGEQFDTCCATIENAFMGREGRRDRIGELVGLTRGLDVGAIPDGDPDEAHEYARQGLDAMSLCLPTTAAPSQRRNFDWMHDDAGILVRMEAVPCYVEALARLCSAVTLDAGVEPMRSMQA